MWLLTQAERDKAAQKKAKMKAVLSLGLAGKKTGGRNRGSTNSLGGWVDGWRPMHA
jgi:hypothetical protein